MVKKLLAIFLVLWAIIIIGMMAINQDSIKYAGEQKALERVARARATTRFVETFYDILAGVTGALAWLAVIALAFVILAGIAILAYSIIEKRWKNRHYAQNGVFPLIDHRLKLPDGSRATLTTNPNLLTAPQTITVHGGENVGSYQLPANFLSESAQVAAMQIGRAANNLQAMPPGRIGSGLYNAMQAPPRPMRIVGEEPDVEPASMPALPLQPMTVGQAFGQSTAERWIVGRGASGALAEFSPATDVHCAILGATGSGKSWGTGVMMLAHALRLGWRAIVLDGKGGDDWSAFAELVEYHEVYPDIFPDQVRSLMDEYDRRRSGEAPLHPMWITIEEYGDTNSSMTRSQAVLANNGLMTIMRKGRDLNMHLCLIDQYPDRWEPQLLQNTKAKFVYWLEDGAIVKQYKAHELAQRGEFFFRGQRYRSFDMRPHVGRLLGIAAPVRHPRLIEGECERVASVQAKGEPLRYGTTEPAKEVGGKWDALIDGYVAENPHILTGELPRGTIAEIARRMAAADGGTKPYENYKGVASDLLGGLRASARVGGEKLGVNVARDGNVAD